MFDKDKKEKRFEVKLKENIGATYVLILVDKITGVNYLGTLGGATSGLTPLLDENGEVVVDK
ncbi:DUF6440 family protein [Clostridium hydrogeniformans]|uniref:DUF6440 family protein n=1 Tax=Clostridium hydrogeniformans TaxID=349933 RepID=UPI0004866CCA|nr:DUF6440 family protein [Clostridium hydrogeniformans]